MSVKEISEAIEAGNVMFGVKQALKGGKKLKNVFKQTNNRGNTHQHNNYVP